MTKNRIKQLIKEKGYTQEEFAKSMGISRAGLVQQIEKPSYPTLEKISSALDVPMWQLFASPEEVTGETNTITCPHCGGKIHFDGRAQ